MRRDIWLDEETDRRLTALIQSMSVGRGAVIRRALDRAEGNFSELGRAAAGDLATIRSAVSRLRHRHAGAADAADLSAIAESTEDLAALLRPKL